MTRVKGPCHAPVTAVVVLIIRRASLSKCFAGRSGGRVLSSLVQGEGGGPGCREISNTGQPARSTPGTDQHASQSTGVCSVAWVEQRHSCHPFWILMQHLWDLLTLFLESPACVLRVHMNDNTESKFQFGLSFIYPYLIHYL